MLSAPEFLLGYATDGAWTSEWSSVVGWSRWPMINPMPEPLEAIIVSLDRDTREMEELAHAMNYSVKHTFIQRRKSPHPKFFVGKGKAEEIAQRLRTADGGGTIKVAVVNSPLKPTQIFHLQNAWDITVFDRTRLILEIFSNRARTQEARLQIELAKLEYEVPLVKELIHRAKMGEHPGYMAGGEYQVDQYYEMIRKRIKKIKTRLRTVKKDRGERRRHRREEGFFLISIAGYTNVGKSMLLRALTKQEVIIEDRVFSTLYTLTRKGEGRRGGAFLFSDTVGFIKNLPPWLIEAFHSTLEEIFLADIVLLVIDVSENIDTVVDKILTSYKFLQFRKELPPIILVFNKTDLLVNRGRAVDEKVSMIISKLAEHDLSYLDHYSISAMDGTNIDLILNGIIDGLEKLKYAKKIKLNLKDRMNNNPGIIKKLTNWLFENFIIIDVDKYEGGISLEILARKKDLGKIKDFSKKLGVLLGI